MVKKTKSKKTGGVIKKTKSSTKNLHKLSNTIKKNNNDDESSVKSLSSFGSVGSLMGFSELGDMDSSLSSSRNSNRSLSLTPTPEPRLEKSNYFKPINTEEKEIENIMHSLKSLDVKKMDVV